MNHRRGATGTSMQIHYAFPVKRKTKPDPPKPLSRSYCRICHHPDELHQDACSQGTCACDGIRILLKRP